MPASIRINKDRRLGTIVLKGAVTGRRLHEDIKLLFEHAEWEPGFGVLWDWRQVEELDVTPEDVRDLVEAHTALASRIGAGRGAIVTARGLDHDIAHLLVFRTKLPDRERRVFRRLDEAMVWLKADGVN